MVSPVSIIFATQIRKEFCNYSPSDKIGQSMRTADIQGPGALQTGRKLYKRRVVTPKA